MITCELSQGAVTFEERRADLRRLRDALREDLDAVNDSVRWLRSERRHLDRGPPPGPV